MPNANIRTRFAPSPTGALHIGGARTALYNYLFAKQHDGQFVLRIEDTDRKRSSDEATLGILRDMQWLGLHWDEGPTLGNPGSVKPLEEQTGDYGPYFQSQRLDRYLPLAEKLVAAGKAYREENGAIRFKADRDIAFTDEVFGEMHFKADDLENFIIIKAPVIEGEDEGKQFPTYHFAVVVDDHDMAITHVIRGQEHLTNTAKHIALFEAFGWEVPTFAHTPSIMNPDGSKMSKRDKAKAARAAASNSGLSEVDAPRLQTIIDQQANFRPDDYFQLDVALLKAFLDKENDDVNIAKVIAGDLKIELPEIDVMDFRRSGYLPEPLLNYLALLGWNPGGDVEQFDMDFMIEHFSLSRVNKANSKFDRTKLLSFNQDAIAKMSAEDFVAAMRDYRQVAGVVAIRFDNKAKDQSWLMKFCEAYQPRAQTLRDPFEQGRFLVLDSITHADELKPDFDNKGIKKALFKGDAGKTGIDGLQAFMPVIESLKDEADFGTKVHDAIQAFCSEQDWNMGKVAQPLRVAISGTPVTPPLDATLDLLGADETIRRCQNLLYAVENR